MFFTYGPYCKIRYWRMPFTMLSFNSIMGCCTFIIWSFTSIPPFTFPTLRHNIHLSIYTAEFSPWKPSNLIILRIFLKFLHISKDIPTLLHHYHNKPHFWAIGREHCHICRHNQIPKSHLSDKGVRVKYKVR